jgi:hypothetical protein
LFAGKGLLTLGMVPMLRCWRGIEAQLAQGKCACGINARHDRTNRAIDNRGRRYIGDGVDDVTHRILPGAVLRESRRKKWKTWRAKTVARAVYTLLLVSAG